MMSEYASITWGDEVNRPSTGIHYSAIELVTPIGAIITWKTLLGEVDHRHAIIWGKGAFITGFDPLRKLNL